MAVPLGWGRLGRATRNRRGARWDDDRGAGVPGGDGLVTRVAVVRAVGHDGVDRAAGLVEQQPNLGRVAVVDGRQRGGDDGVGGRVDGQMEFSPGPAPAHAMLIAVPLADPVDLEPGAVNHQGDRPRWQCRGQHRRPARRAPTDRGVIGNRQIDVHEIQQRTEQPFGLAQRLMEDKPDHDRSFDRGVRVARLTARRHSRRCAPGGNRLLADPQRQTTAPPQAGFVHRPVRHLELHLRDVMAAGVIVLVRHVRTGQSRGTREGVLLHHDPGPANLSLAAPTPWLLPKIRRYAVTPSLLFRTIFHNAQLILNSRNF